MGNTLRSLRGYKLIKNTTKVFVQSIAFVLIFDIIK